MESEYRIRYDPSMDVLYIKIRDGKTADSDEVDEGVIVDFDKDGNALSIEILEFSKRKIDLNDLVVKGLRVLVKA